MSFRIKKQQFLNLYIQDIVSTARECSIYESIELGGIDADELQTILQKVIEDFKSAYSVFRGKT